MRRLVALLVAAMALWPIAALGDAHSIEYRPLDTCAPPQCRITTPAVTDAGYAIIGSDKTELFARRAIRLGAGEKLAFDLPASGDPSALEMSLASGDPKGGPFDAVLEVRADQQVLMHEQITGRSAEFALPRESAGFGREDRYFTRFRVDLPSRRDRGVVVSVRNEAAGTLVVASPLVYRRVSGRPARHAVLVILDAVPHPLLMQMFTGGGWISDWVSGRGLLFSQAMSPGQLTGSFVRRFFKADYYRLDGEPSLFGQDFFETPPDVVVGPVARIAEQGFFTLAIGSNLYLTPVLGRIGFDGNYNLESTLDLPADPPIVARRFDEEMAVHADDDALFVVWFGSTHMPWRQGKAGTPPIRDFEIPASDLDSDVLSPIWKNLWEAVGSLEQIKQSAERRAPSADRIWIIGADHGHTFTLESRDRPWRLTGEAVDRGHMHCCLSTQQEVRTPLAIITEKGPATRGTAPQPISTMVAWRSIEKHFGVDLGLPQTSAFALPGENAFDDGVIVSVGNSGTLAARSGDLSYRSHEPARHLAPVWSVGAEIALLLAGTPARAKDIVSEELYDLKTDPGERNNRAADDFWDGLLGMREKVTNWLAEYADTPDRPRYRYGLAFGGPVTLKFTAPRAFTIAVDGRRAIVEDRSATFTGSRFEIHDGDVPVGVVDLSGESFVARCASSGLPVATIDPAHARLNLALARNNCPTDQRAPAAAPRPGEAVFDATLVSSRAAQAGPGGRLPELQNALRRWGYVRDK